jgi:hypothetical protein
MSIVSSCWQIHRLKMRVENHHAANRALHLEARLRASACHGAVPPLQPSNTDQFLDLRGRSPVCVWPFSRLQSLQAC